LLAQLDTVLEERRLAKAVEAEEPSFADEPEVDQVSESREPAPAAQAAPSIAETMLLPPSMPRPDPVQVHLGLAKEHLESGRYNEAAEAFARVLELNPGHAEAKAGLTEAESQRVSAQRGEFSSIPEMRFAEGRPARETAWWVSGWAYLSEELRASRKWLLTSGGAVILLGVGFLFYQMLGSAPATGIPPTSAAAPKLASAEPATGPNLDVVQQPDKTNTTATSGQPGAAKAPKAGSSPPSAAKSTEIPGKMVLLKPPQTGQDSAEIERLKRDYEARLKAMEGELKRQREVQTPGESESAANGGEPATAKKIEQKAGQKTEQTAEQKADQTAALPPAAAPPLATVPVEQPPPQPKVEAQVEEGNAVDIVPRPTARVTPSYPPAGRRLKISGRVLVSVLVDERGEVIQAKILRSDHNLLNSAALEAARKWKFIPASGNGRAVQAWYTLPEFEFRPN
jgi:TonB family protein